MLPSYRCSTHSLPQTSLSARSIRPAIAQMCPWTINHAGADRPFATNRRKGRAKVKQTAVNVQSFCCWCCTWVSLPTQPPLPFCCSSFISNPWFPLPERLRELQQQFRYLLFSLSLYNIYAAGKAVDTRCVQTVKRSPTANSVSYCIIVLWCPKPASDFKDLWWLEHCFSRCYNRLCLPLWYVEVCPSNKSLKPDA